MLTLPEQAAIVLQAFEFLAHDDIIRWVDNSIVHLEKPPEALLKLSVLGPDKVVEMVSNLRILAPSPMAIHQQVQVIVLTHRSGLLSMRAALGRIFEILFDEDDDVPHDSLRERIKDALVYWDCQEEDVIDPPLQATFTEIFQEYLKGADDIVAVLPRKFAASA